VKAAEPIGDGAEQPGRADWHKAACRSRSAIGCDAQTAIADLIDNSIAAQARNECFVGAASTPRSAFPHGTIASRPGGRSYGAVPIGAPARRLCAYRIRRRLVRVTQNNSIALPREDLLAWGRRVKGLLRILRQFVRAFLGVGTFTRAFSAHILEHPAYRPRATLRVAAIARVLALLESGAGGSVLLLASGARYRTTLLCASIWVGCLLSTGVYAATPAISAGGSHTIGLTSNGTVRTWGNDSYGQLGIGRLLQSSNPISSSGISGFKAISAGGNHTVALKADGSVWA